MTTFMINFIEESCKRLFSFRKYFYSYIGRRAFAMAHASGEAYGSTYVLLFRNINMPDNRRDMEAVWKEGRTEKCWKQMRSKDT